MFGRRMTQPFLMVWRQVTESTRIPQYLAFTIVFIVCSFAYSMAYCHFYVNYYAEGHTSFMDSCLWSVRKCGVWWVACPLVLKAYSKLGLTKPIAVAGFYLGTIGFSTFYSLALDVFFFAPETHIITSMVIFLPTHIGLATFVILGWWVLFAGHASDLKLVREPTLEQIPSPYTPKLLRVQTGTQEVEIPVDTIESISASGNYMEVFDGQRSYLMRSTMKELEQNLGANQFVRIHRSHLVNRGAIQSISANQRVILNSGQSFPISQRYRVNIK